ncbi:E3 ubiquitin-protein ligase NRDP1-like [Oppia nitens]|uniref:E3 ubiquitin-protein ligase NRDP1-like n=1 Tax=Oppia nitens TaxID=1686743 RepID=UPI0023DC0BDF|nr:E3 ubiquitin-protein ligase NRDP1-like [Oppia nitens]
MGIDLEIFNEDVSDDLRCSICLEVYDQPIQIATCKHIFCAHCIHKWIEKCGQQPTCPHDRRKISKYVLKQAPKLIKKEINQLKVKCNFRSNGCFASIKYSDLKQHLNTCIYNPKYPKKSGNWLKRTSICNVNKSNYDTSRTNYVYLTTMPSLYSYSYCTIANRY